jgi:cytosine permease
MRDLRARLGRAVEHSPFKPVTGADHRGWFFLATIKVGVMICVPLFALGGDLGAHMRFVDLVPALLAGSIGTALLATLTGLVGMRARVPTAMLVRTTFGELGGKFVAAILLVTLFGWFGVQTEVLVNSINALLQASLGLRLPPLMLTVVCGALISTTAIIGFRALGKVAYVAVPLLLAVIAVPTWMALSTHEVGPLLSAPAAALPYSFGMVVSIVTGGHMVAVAITPDITRFMRSGRDTVIGVAIGYAIMLPILVSLAALLAAVYRNPDLVAIMIATGVGGPALLVIVLATWTSNDKNLYESSLAMSSLVPGVARWKLTAAAAAIGTALAAAGIFSHFISMLIFMGIGIAPVAGVYLVDFWLDAGRYQRAEVVRVRIGSLAAWGVGILVGLATLPQAAGGFGWFTLTSASTLDALLGAAVAQVLFARRPRGDRSK